MLFKGKFGKEEALNSLICIETYPGVSIGEICWMNKKNKEI